MCCSNCGRENDISALFCVECGAPIQGHQDAEQPQNQIFIEEKQTNEPKKKKWMFFGAIIAVILLLIMIFGSDSDNIEYTHNAGDKLPIVVNQISIEDSFWNGFINITFEIENLTQSDYKNVNKAVLAWDSEGYPLKMCAMYDFLDPTYINYISLENVSPGKLDEYSYTFDPADFDTTDIKYISVFLSYYKDFKNNEWENPIMGYIEENQGKKLNETKIYYFTLHQSELN